MIEAIQFPDWFPYGVRRRWDSARVRRAVQGIERTRPCQSMAAERADASLFMLVCRRDVRIAVLALKSLLRYPDVRVSVVLTDDGSLSASDRSWIDRHVVGCRWLPRNSNDPALVAALGNWTRLSKLYKSNYHPICKLLHPALLSETEQVIILDPDSAFFEYPKRLVDWLRGCSESALYLHDVQDEKLAVPDLVREAFENLRSSLTKSPERWSMPYYFFNSGLLAYRTSQFDLNVGEEYLEWRDRAPNSYREGKPALWFGDWTPEQTAYQLMFAMMDPTPLPLGPQYAIGGRSGCVFNHFLWLQLVLPGTLRRLRGFVNELD